MREEGGVKVKSHSPFLREVDPFLEMLGFKAVAVGKLTLFEDGVAGMNIYFFL